MAQHHATEAQQGLGHARTGATWSSSCERAIRTEGGR
jgi:hypothetical protein